MSATAILPITELGEQFSRQRGPEQPYSPLKMVSNNITEQKFVISENLETQKLIAANMESVIATVKRQCRQSRSRHRHKHNHSKEGSTSGPEKEKNGEPLSEKSTDGTSAPTKSIHKKRHKSRQTSWIRSAIKQNTIDSDPIKENNPELVGKIEVVANKVDLTENSIDEPQPKMVNAFQIMMNARHSVIGSNSDGKDITVDESIETDAIKQRKQNRKSILGEWADRKGRAKRKIDDIEDGEYIDIEMKKRAKRLKRLLLNGEGTRDKKEKPNHNSIITKPSPPVSSVEPLTEHVEDSVEVLVSKKEETIEISPIKQDKEPADSGDSFLQKLSSPIKRKDNLLGFFTRTITPKSETDSPVNGITPEKPIKKKMKKNTKQVERLNSETTPETPTITPTGRPKRKCTERIISYEHLNEGIVTAVDEIKKPNKAIKSNDNNETLTRLAPLFVKKKIIPKPKIDPEIIRARRAFLMSSIPDEMRIVIDRQKVVCEQYETPIDLFPRFSHIRQISDIDLPITNSKLLDSIRIMEDAVGPFDCSIIETKINRQNLLDGYLINCQNGHFKIGNESNKNDVKFDIREINAPKSLLKSLKIADNFPYNRCYKQLKAKQSMDFSTRQSDVIPCPTNADCSIEIIDDHENDRNGIMQFTDKYKPFSSSDFIVNGSATMELRKFLSNWLETADRCYSDDDDDAFDLGSSAHSTSSTSLLNSAILLIGPHSSGKTSSVYAVANELRFKVLEVNAGSKRSGKRFLQDLHEATQSHSVQNSNTESEESSQSQSLSLILIEDADLVFDQDQGFEDAIYQLIGTSKRPVILVATNDNCPHLLRIKSHNYIKFTQPKSDGIAKWLSTMSIVENMYIDATDIKRLYKLNGKDLRKTILELQFFIQGGGDRKQVTDKHETLVRVYTENQNDKNRMACPANFEFARMIMGKMLCDATTEERKSERMESISDYYNQLSHSYYLSDKIGECSDRSVNNLGEEIVQEIVERSLIGLNDDLIKKPLDSKSWTYDSRIFPTKEPLITLARSINPTTLPNSRSTYIDYEPMLRSICRSEHKRSTTERRSSRFYHYLKKIAPQPQIYDFSRVRGMNGARTEIFDLHCTIFANGARSLEDSWKTEYN